MVASRVPPSEPLVPLGASLFAARVPIPYPMRFVTVVIDASPPVTLVDAALDTPEARAGLESALATLGLGWDDVGRVIVTHHHPDHYGLAGWVQRRSGAGVRMLDVDLERGERHWSDWEPWLDAHVAHLLRHGLPPELEAETREDSRLTRARVHPAARIEPLVEGERVELGGASFEVLWLPGHADGHLGLWHESSGLLVAGDAILERITPNVGLYAKSRPDPLGDYLGTLDRLERLGARRAVIGHYGPVLEDVAGRAREIRAHHRARLDETLGSLDAPRTAFEASFRMFPQDLNPAGRRFAVAETLAHLEHLRRRGELVLLDTGRVVRFARPDAA